MKSNNGIEGIYTGFVRVKGYCHVPKILFPDTKEGKLLGYDHNKGFVIPKEDTTPACRIYWNYNVTVQNGGDYTYFFNFKKLFFLDK